MSVFRKVNSSKIGLANLLNALNENKAVKIGYFENDKYEDGRSVASVAATQELGSPKHKIPPRPTMRPALNKNVGVVTSLVKQHLIHSIVTDSPILNVYELVGVELESKVKEEILALTTPALSKRTIEERRGKYLTNNLKKRLGKRQAASLSKPLIDSARMLRSVTHIVENE